MSWTHPQVPRRVRLEQAPLPTADEQGLCLGACFTIAVSRLAVPTGTDYQQWQEVYFEGTASSSRNGMNGPAE